MPKTPHLLTSTLFALAMASLGGCLATEHTAEETSQPKAAANPAPKAPAGTDDARSATHLAAAHRVDWLAYTPNDQGISEYAKLSAVVDTLPEPGVEATWTPRAQISLYLQQVDLHTGAQRLAEIIPTQAATVTARDAQGFELTIADGTVIRLEAAAAFLLNVGPATEAVLAEASTWALAGIGWCGAMTGDGYVAQALGLGTYAPLDAEVYQRLAVAEQPTAYGTFTKQLISGAFDVLCDRDPGTQHTRCHLTVVSPTMTAVDAMSVALVGTAASAQHAAILRAALLPDGASAGQFGDISVTCDAQACAASFVKERAQLASELAF